MIDSYRHKGLRQQLVKELIGKGIKDPLVLGAIGRIPRHLFLDGAFAEWAYKDVAFPIGSDQTISQPYTVARQTELLELEPGQKILEIGTGSGYQACVLVEMGVKVYSIERQESLFKKTQKFVHDLGYKQIRTLYGDGYLGSERFAPFDRIIVTAGAPMIPEALKQQLKVGGHLVIPVGAGESQRMLRLTRTGDQSFTEEDFGLFSFVPFLKGTARI